MTDVDLEARHQIEALQELFRPHLADRVREIEAAWEAVQAGGGTGGHPGGEPPLRRFYRLAHSLAGTAGSFGYPAVGTAARDLERHLKELVPADGAATPTTIPSGAEIRPLLAALAQAAQAAMGG